MNPRDKPLEDLIKELQAILTENRQRGHVVRHMRDSLQQIEEGILELGKRLHEQDAIIRELKKPDP